MRFLKREHRFSAKTEIPLRADECHRSEAPGAFRSQAGSSDVHEDASRQRGEVVSCSHETRKALMLLYDRKERE